MVNYAIEIKGLVKKFGNNTVVNIDKLEIEKGKMIGILGPNGAGKSTTINMMMGLIKQDAGEIFYNGSKQFEKKSLGLVPQDIALYPELNAIDNLNFFGSLYGKRAEIKKQVDQMIKKIDLESKAKNPIKSYSGGMKRRVNIGAGLIHEPETIFMDEPTVGIDPQSRNKIYEIITNLKVQNKTIIYTTHYMEEVEKMCDYVYIIDRGQVIESGTIKQLIAKTHQGVLELVIPDADNEQVINIIQQINSIKLYGEEKGVYSILLFEMPQKLIGEIMSTLERQSIHVVDFSFHQPNLETLFLLLTGKALRE